MFALALRQSSSFAASSSSSSSRRRSSSLRNVSIAQTRYVRRHDRLRLKTWTLRASSSSDDEEDEDDSIDEDRADVRSIEDAKRELEYGMRFGKRMKKRFQPKKVKDRGLPIADALVLTSATVLVALVSLSQHKAPSWLNAEYLREVPRILPNLPALVGSVVHGSKLSAVWVLGALAAEAYETEAYDADFAEAMKRTVKAGCFAVGLLILVEQNEMRQALEHVIGMPASEYVVGENREADLLINSKTSELFVDCASCAVAMLSWRIIRWNSSVPGDDLPFN
ncbi:unnamed protein product [Bathycoccus prasinos]|mmetsp:Transcript_1035/g.3801  ORF Transcript_1035/g.3801 Transcript_1035/m.3801 type:complete len:281 (+) Transcript_1035:98-940(+)